MSIAVNNLTKVFGTQKAVDGISFSVKQGEILGFLGPNGAGKTTTMRVAACYLPPTSGTVTVCGYDVMESSIEVRKSVGYLAEHNPLYTDMYVHEYLQFIGSLYNLKSTKLKSSVEKMIQLCGLSPEQNKKIGTLSKGFRQRVGLAQALIHDPEVLIMDEPTSGLDPNQIIEIREVIKNIGKEKTVVFSTHILQEVEAICDRVVIINEGKIVADSKVADLIKQKSSLESVFQKLTKG
ncbi:MAG: ATP-binding cassette domain-containing protein [Bacteroidetes bacterium]|nr:ATP-binding cassette domain-containing protein [Bacteroidota bacterium]